jgi:hypothetical protein
VKKVSAWITSDDDLIRRGDVLARLAKHGVQFGETSDAYHAVAALPAVQPWLSMDTAHKDGRPIAIFIAKDGTVERCVWRTTKENPKGYWWGRSGRCFPGCGEPTCWVPLPQAINTGKETK